MTHTKARAISKRLKRVNDKLKKVMRECIDPAYEAFDEALKEEENQKILGNIKGARFSLFSEAKGVMKMFNELGLAFEDLDKSVESFHTTAHAGGRRRKK